MELRDHGRSLAGWIDGWMSDGGHGADLISVLAGTAV